MSIFFPDPWDDVYTAWFGSHATGETEYGMYGRLAQVERLGRPTWEGGLGLTPDEALHILQANGGNGPPSWQFEGKSLGDQLEDAGRAIGKVIKAAAPFVAMIPGVGTVVGTAMYAVGSAAAGDRIDDIAITTVEQVLPPNTRKAYRQAVEIGYGIARGKRVDDMAYQLARDEAKAQGGAEAVAAFDVGIAAGKGRGLQDAGFQLMGAWVKGNDAGERAVIFAHDVTEAAQEGKSVGEFIKDEAAAQFLQSVPAVNQALMLERAIRYLLSHPELLKRQVVDKTVVVDPKFSLNWQDLADRAGVPIEAIRAAIICIKEMADGTLAEDPNEVHRMLTRPVVRAIGLGETVAAEAANNVWAEQGRRIMATGATWTNPSNVPVRLDSIRNGRVWTTKRYDGSIVTDTINDKWRRGFDVAIGNCEDKTAPGPGQTLIRDSLRNGSAVAGYDAGQKLQHERTKQSSLLKGIEAMSLFRETLLSPEEKQHIESCAAAGRVEASTNPQVAAARALRPEGEYKWGFDVGTGECKGKSAPGPGQTAWRNLLGVRADAGEGGGPPSQLAVQGFDVAQALQHGISKAILNRQSTVAATPNLGAGILIANGLAGSGADPRVKANALSAAAEDPETRQGAAQVIAKKTGFFHAIAEFFGFAD